MKKNKLKSVLFVIFNIFLIVALVLGLYYGLYKLRLIALPEFLQWLIADDSQKEITVIPGDDGVIYDSIMNEGNEFVEVKTGLTIDNVRLLIENIKNDVNYYWEGDLTLFSNGESLKTKSIIRYYNGLYRVEVYDKNGFLQKIAAENNTVLTEKVYNSYDGIYKTKNYPTKSMSLYAEAGVPDINKFLEADNTRNVSYSLIESDFGTLICLEFDYSIESYTQREIYFVSLDYGICVRAETYENGELVYLCESKTLKALTEPSDNLFTIE